MPPLVIGAAALAVSSAVGAAAGSAFIGGLAGLGVSFLGNSLLNKAASNEKSALDASFTLTQRSAAQPRKIVYGNTRIGGNVVYQGTDSTGDVLHMVVAYAGVAVDNVYAVSIDDNFYPHATQCIEIFPNSYAPTSGPYAYGSSGTDYIDIAFSPHTGQPGLPQNQGNDLPDPYLLASGGGPAEWPHTSVGTDICYIYFRLYYQAGVYKNGVPNFTAHVTGRRCYDPRTGTTAWTANPIVILRDYLTGVDQSGQPIGLGCTPLQINDAAFIAQANICDEQILLDDHVTYEAQFNCNGSFASDSTTLKIIEDILSTCGGWLVWQGGMFTPYVAAWVTPTDTIDESWLRGKVTVQSTPSRQSLFNSTRATYINAEGRYQPDDATEYTDPVAVAQDGGVQLWKDIQLPMTYSNASAYRLQQLTEKRARNGLVATLECNWRALEATVGDTALVSISKLQWSGKTMRVIGWKLASGDGIDLVLQADAPGAYTVDPGTNPIPNQPTLPYPWAVAPPTGVTTVSSPYVSGNSSSPGIEVGWVASNGPNLDHYVVRWGTDGVNWSYSVNLWYELNSYHILDGLTFGLTYIVEVAAFNTTGTQSQWETGPDCTPAAAFPVPVAPGGVTTASLAGGIETAWSSVPDASVLGYYVYAAPGYGAPFSAASKIATVGQSTLSYNQTGIGSGTQQTMFVQAYNQAGPGTVSAGVNGVSS